MIHQSPLAVELRSNGLCVKTEITASSYWLLWTKECADAHFLNWMKSQFGIA
jgi:hypothetical protein